MAQLGQVGKRLHIIKIAISITDKETINLQHSKLRLFKNDKLLQNILSVLDDENYAQASNLINRYLHGPYDEDVTDDKVSMMEEKAAILEEKAALIKAKLLENEKNKKKELTKKFRDIEEEELINKFGLFRERGREEIYNPIDKEEMKAMEKEIFYSEEKRKKEIKMPSIDDIMAGFDSIRDDIPVKASILEAEKKSRRSASYKEEHSPQEKGENFFSTPEKNILEETETEVEKREKLDDKDLFDQAISKVKDEPEIIIIEEVTLEEGPNKEEEFFIQEKEPEIKDEENLEPLEMTTQESSEEEPEQETQSTEHNEPAIVPKEYEPISYIDQKLRNMLNQYPQTEETSEQYKSEERLLYKISLHGYNEEDIEKVIENIKTLKQEGKKGEAAHLLLTIATTESLYAQFTFARELYQGDILIRDLPEAFTQINYLASEKYPEAICDLAQFYEHGIGIKKDKKKAFILYEEAETLGVSRASTHLNRLERESRGLLGKLFKK